ncbi:DUF5719 family protein [Galbitalea soli]|uniref:Large extracellular alpha-helical protein n=1 Tax=Galbitalea soli TaxID=1268042 RepID=A0A7C9TR41_9MICO|nr:DUF5719 family protein [Galbitalea soli]NEM91361.1 hypothetical protein [Galbitalea soli]NYJ30052.1 hypothetical protein [Galbitalea soli]
MPDEREAPPEEIVVIPSDDGDLDPRTPRAKPTLRGAAIVSARVIAGFVAIAVAAAVIAAAALVPLPSIRHGAPSAMITPVPTQQQLTCPGGLLRLSDASGAGATRVSALGAPAVTSGATAGSVSVTPFTQSDAHTSGSSAAPQLVTAAGTPGASSSPLVAAAQAQSINTEEAFGLAAAACVAPSSDAWLDGGSTAIGRTTLVSLSNPSEVDATVTLQIFDEKGPVTSPGMSGIVVRPHGQRVLSLAGFAPSVGAPVVHVTSTGGQIVAVLQQSTIRGLAPGGVDIVSPQPGPATRTVLTGISLEGGAAVDAVLGTRGYEDLAPVLRLFVPGSKDLTATVSVIPESSSAKANSFPVDVTAGHVTDVPFDDLSDGHYTFVVTTTQPVLAAVRVSTVGSAAVGSRADFAWTPAGRPLGAVALLATPLGQASILHVYNPAPRAATVTVTAQGAPATRHQISAGGAIAIVEPPGSSIRLDGPAGLYAAVTGSTDGGVSAFAVTPAQAASTPIRVYR